MKVKLLTHTKDPEKTVAAAAKLCYSKSDISTLMDGLTDEKVANFLEKLSNLGHASPLEHASFTFGIEGVSRSFLAQISRHRIASFSVQSQRYVDMDNADHVVPKEIYDAGYSVVRLYEESVKNSFNNYNELKEELTKKYIAEGMKESPAKKKAQEDARYLLPEACCTRMIVTMNARELNHFFNLRCCNRASREIREVAEEMLKLVYPVAPHLFKSAGPSCVCGACPEGNMSCGKAKEMREKYNIIKNGENNG
jgi:thymidylate synthase (FAD)